ncbi:MAG: endonuclease III [Bacilli bacterium]|nr:endonuclease III [Bacilli bacterium]
MKNQKNKLKEIQEFMDEEFANVGCELHYKTDYELLIAVMLSAQTTDVAVNSVTDVLFSKYDTLEKLNSVSLEEVEKTIQPIGIYKNKAKRLKEIVSTLLSDFDGKVPCDTELLTKLPGVGNKTACVTRAEVFKIPEFPVDTHVLRISKRLGLCSLKDEPIECEAKLKKTFERENWIKLHHQFIHFGRAICKAQSPICDRCKLKEYCNRH